MQGGINWSFSRANICIAGMSLQLGLILRKQWDSSSLPILGSGFLVLPVPGIVGHRKARKGRKDSGAAGELGL